MQWNLLSNLMQTLSYLILSESNMKKKKKKQIKRQCSFMNYTNEYECHLNSINMTRTYIHIYT